MPFIENEKYEGVVSSAAFVTSAEKGTGGLSLVVSTSEGPVDRTFWVTANTVERLKENLGEVFGVTGDQLQNEQFIEGGVSEFLKGRNCSVVVEHQKDSNGNIYSDKDGRKYFTIKWLNPSRMGKKAVGASVKKITGLFGGGSSSGNSQEPPPVDWGGTPNEDVPF
jgi:hypothetical protein